MNKRPYNTPDGYFDYLQMRLSEIPERQQAETVPEVKVSRWAKVAPYFALVACFVAILVTGRYVIDKTTVPAQNDNYLTMENLYSADLVPYTSQYALFDEDYFQQTGYSSEVSEEDIINYLIDSYLPLNYIGQALMEY
jgi:hypothetical protein